MKAFKFKFGITTVVMTLYLTKKVIKKYKDLVLEFLQV